MFSTLVSPEARGRSVASCGSSTKLHFQHQLGCAALIPFRRQKAGVLLMDRSFCGGRPRGEDASPTRE